MFKACEIRKGAEESEESEAARRGKERQRKVPVAVTIVVKILGMCLHEALRAYEARRLRSADRDEHLLLRSRMVQTQAQGRWIDLIGQFRAAILTVNTEAGRALLRVENSPGTRLRIEREDGIAIQVQYNSALHRVNCSEPSADTSAREIELKALPVDGNDSTVWVDRTTRRLVPDAQIAEAVLQSLLQFAPIHA